MLSVISVIDNAVGGFTILPIASPIISTVGVLPPAIIAFAVDSVALLLNLEDGKEEVGEYTENEVTATKRHRKENNGNNDIIAVIKEEARGWYVADPL